MKIYRKIGWDVLTDAIADLPPDQPEMHRPQAVYLSMEDLPL